MGQSVGKATVIQHLWGKRPPPMLHRERVEGDSQLSNRLGPEPAATCSPSLRSSSKLLAFTISFNPYNHSVNRKLFPCLTNEKTEAQGSCVTWLRFRYKGKQKGGNDRERIWTQDHRLSNTLCTVLDYLLYEYLCNMSSYSLYFYLSFFNHGTGHQTLGNLIF